MNKHICIIVAVKQTRMKFVSSLFALIFFAETSLLAGEAPDVSASDSAVSCVSIGDTPYSFKAKRFIVPVALMATGIAAVESDWAKDLNHDIRDNLQDIVGSHVRIDDYMQYSPVAAMYALHLFRVDSKHDFIDQTILFATSHAIMTSSARCMKIVWDEERPSSHATNSFPSGHTATAFMCAHLLAREYWDVSPWIGIGGYTVAAGVGFLRMYNDRHWLTDVVGGAGLGIMSVEVAHLLYPFLAKHIFKGRKNHNIYLLPYYQTETQAVGMTCNLRF